MSRDASRMPWGLTSWQPSLLPIDGQLSLDQDEQDDTEHDGDAD